MVPGCFSTAYGGAGSSCQKHTGEQGDTKAMQGVGGELC